MPHNAQAEAALLGSYLINSDGFIDTEGLVRASDFYIVRHAWIFAAMQDLRTAGQPVDTITLLDELERRGQLAEIGGPGYVSQLINSAPTSANAEAYARIVAGKATRRRLLQAASHIAEAAYDDHLDDAEVLTYSQGQVMNVADELAGEDEVVSFKEAAHEVWQEAGAWRDRPLGPGETRGLPWGLVDLDQATLGFLPGEYVIVCGRPGVGKSTLAMQGGNHLTTIYSPALKRNYHTLIFSLEMGRRQVFRREACAMARLNYRNVKTGHITDPEWEAFTSAHARIAERQGWIRTKSVTPQDIERICRRYQARYGLDEVIIDHLGKVRVPGATKEYEIQSIVSGEIARIGHDLGIVMVGICQLNRDVEKRQDKRPTLADLRASGHIEEDADWVLGLYRPAYYDSQSKDKTAMCYLLKTRDDAPADVTLIFEPEQTRFDNAQVVYLEEADAEE